MVQAPIFHVNGDDPEAVVFATQLAVDFRNQFKKDVVIDLVCYRRRGHNEADEPSVTQPMMYATIKGHPSTRDLYAQRLIAEDVLTKDEDDALMERYRESLDRGEPMVAQLVMEPNTGLFVDWKPFIGHSWDIECDTTVALSRLRELAEGMGQVPEGFAVQRQVKKLIEDRNKMAAGALEVNWGFAENMAYATLLAEGYPVRMTGQDVGRGTFSHRHAVLHAQNKHHAHVPLQHISDDQAEFNIYDSLLSEEAVLAFEYGYATTAPTGLVIWEAQFGDFANGAQVVIDQFITSGEYKWARLCGLTMLLPHGYEGQGPEHSSARLERYLQLAAQENIQVCVPSTPAQVFHMLRRQAIRPLRKPLIVMSPKSLLRHKAAVSTMDELATGQFQNVIDDPHVADKSAVTRVVLCSGKVFYDLDAARDEKGSEHVALVRIEQLYPLPEAQLKEVLSSYPREANVVWCQEEPMNQGAWYSIQDPLRRLVSLSMFGAELRYIGRTASASVSAGYTALHVKEQDAFISAALG
jgi:2-oxoglutarate dehydrogenase E1 component